MEQFIDSWQSGSSYEQFMGRWSALVAKEFLDWLPVSQGKDWLEVGCGTGAISNIILRTKEPNEILAIDSSPDFIAFARKIHKDQRLRFEIGLAQSLPVESKCFEAVVSGLVLNFVPQPEQALAEMRRVTKPDGIIAAFVWDYVGGMQMLRYFWDAAVSLDKNAAGLDEGLRFPLCQEGNLEKLFIEGGLGEVRFRAIEVLSVFSSFEDYWLPFLSGVGPAPGYVMSLAEAQRKALMDLLRATLPVAADGSISLTSRAWAVQGRA